MSYPINPTLQIDLGYSQDAKDVDPALGQQGTGLLTYCDIVQSRWPSLKIFVNDWNDPAAQVVNRLNAEKSDCIILACYSYGNVAAQNQCNKCGLVVDHMQAIDAVRWHGIDFIASSTPSSEPFWIPATVKSVSTFRQVNNVLFLPFSSEIALSNPETKIEMQTAWGSEWSLDHFQPAGKRIVNPNTNHVNFDCLPELFDYLLADLALVLGPGVTV